MNTRTHRLTSWLVAISAAFALASFAAAGAQPVAAPHLERSEAWAPHPLAAPKVAPPADGCVVIEANGTQTCTGGWQFTYSGVRGGQTYRLRTQVDHRDVASPRDSLQALALWGTWNPSDNTTRKIPYNHLLPRAVSPSASEFECVVTAPENATALTIRYVFRWSAQGTSSWSAPQIEPATASERKPVRICVVSSAAKNNAATGSEPISVGACALDPVIEPESARMLALGGADFICLPIMGDLRADRLTPGPPIFNEDRWKAIMRTRALDNQVTLVVARNGGQGSCIIDRRGDIIAWNEGDRSIVEATIPAEDIRYWAGGDLAEVTYLLRRPALYDRYTDEAGLGPLPSPSALPTTNRP